MWEQKHESWHSTPVPFPLLLSHTPQTNAQQGPKGQGSCLKLCFMRYQQENHAQELGSGKLGFREGATRRLDTKHRGSSNAPCEQAGKRRVLQPIQSREIRRLPQKLSQQFRLASQKKGLPTPNKPSGLKMILIHTVVELAPIKT